MNKKNKIANIKNAIKTIKENPDKYVCGDLIIEHLGFKLNKFLDYENKY